MNEKSFYVEGVPEDLQKLFRLFLSFLHHEDQQLGTGEFCTIKKPYDTVLRVYSDGEIVFVAPETVAEETHIIAPQQLRLLKEKGLIRSCFEESFTIRNNATFEQTAAKGGKDVIEAWVIKRVRESGKGGILYAALKAEVAKQYDHLTKQSIHGMLIQLTNRKRYKRQNYLSPLIRVGMRVYEPTQMESIPTFDPVADGRRKRQLDESSGTVAQPYLPPLSPHIPMEYASRFAQNAGADLLANLKEPTFDAVVALFTTLYRVGSKKKVSMERVVKLFSALWASVPPDAKRPDLFEQILEHLKVATIKK